MIERDRAEAARQAGLDAYAIIDTLEEQAYDDLTRMAAELFKTPIAIIAFLDRDRSCFKPRIGIEAKQAPREFALCEHLILKPGEVLVVNDASTDDRFRANPLVVGDPNIRFYVGAPLVSPSGQTLGAICAVDTQPRETDAAQIEMLQFLAQQVVTKLEERRRALALKLQA